MSSVVPTIEQLEEYLDTLEDYVFSSLQAATPDLPHVSDAIHRLWEDVSRFGPQSMPSLPDIHIPSLGTFEVPPPPPPPPPPKSFWEHSADWAAEHPWTTAGIGVSVVGAGLLVGYGSAYINASIKSSRLRSAGGTERRQAVVVLGGDTPSGLPLILELERKGYVVIVSVSAPEHVEEVERKGHGYIRALVLDPSEPATIPYFLRSLASTLSRRFPMTASGDPHSSPSTHLYIHSVICLLTLPAPGVLPAPAPLEHLGLRDTYSSYLQATHISPLEVLQAMMPLLRNSSARARDAFANNLGKKSIIVCLPVTDARVGVPFASAQAMSAAATLRGVEVLRREIRMAALTDTSESMKNIKVVVVDVGSVGSSPAQNEEAPHDAHTSMIDWTPSEKVAYGTAFSSVMEEGMQFGVHRKPTDVSVFVNTLVDVVGNGQKSDRTAFGILFGLGLGRIREWLRGDRVIVGAGARTYGLASHLPALLLDTLLNIPHLLVSIRNSLLPVPPRLGADATMPPREVPRPAVVARKLESEESPLSSDQEHQHEHDTSENGSEADVESNEGYGSGVAESWVSLKGASPERGDASGRP
ncbi:hypothetical protein B0H21DRAFT_889176 [Amylocystis lapponica]|nr:hypothetical protein B0H21DRAFT_889176 [Amylocystis lapponica]